jgi:hypothetical protein
MGAQTETRNPNALSPIVEQIPDPPAGSRPAYVGLPAHKRKRFLATMRKHGVSINAARKACGIPKQTLYDAFSADPAFRAEVDEVIGQQQVKAESAVRKAAVTGDKNGKIDARLAELYLVNRFPEDWQPLSRFNVIAQAGAVAMGTMPLEEMPSEQREKLIQASNNTLEKLVGIE